MAVVHYKTPYGRRRSGLCSSFLASLSVGDDVYIKIKHGGLRETALNQAVSLIRSSTSSIASGTDRLVLVGPGTGVAPMRSIIEQYCSGSEGDMTSSPTGLPRILLLFGCRKHQSDYLFGSKWDALNSSSSGDVKVVTAFSQDQTSKDYVTHAIDRNSSIIAQMIQEVSVLIYSYIES